MRQCATIRHMMTRVTGASVMKARVYHLISSFLLLCVFSASHQAVAKEKLVRVHARTPAEIVAAFSAASTSGVPTIIKVAPGHYQFSTKFESVEFGASSLPPVHTTIVIMGEDADNTFIDGGRTFTVTEGGRLF